MDVFHVKDGVGVAGSETRVSEGGQSYDIGDDAIWWCFQMMIALVAPVLLLIYSHVAPTTRCTHQKSLSIAI